MPLTYSLGDLRTSRFLTLTISLTSQYLAVVFSLHSPLCVSVIQTSSPLPSQQNTVMQFRVCSI